MELRVDKTLYEQKQRENVIKNASGDSKGLGTRIDPWSFSIPLHTASVNVFLIGTSKIAAKRSLSFKKLDAYLGSH